jgi:hypothetical protein
MLNQFGCALHAVQPASQVSAGQDMRPPHAFPETKRVCSSPFVRDCNQPMCTNDVAAQEMADGHGRVARQTSTCVVMQPTIHAQHAP